MRHEGLVRAVFGAALLAATISLPAQAQPQSPPLSAADDEQRLANALQSIQPQLTEGTPLFLGKPS